MNMLLASQIMERIASWIVFGLCGGILCFGKICNQDGKPVCCSGYKRNTTTNVCDECPAGYRGPECIYKCEYPTYGPNCDKTCRCTEEQCDFQFGCKLSSSSFNSTKFWMDQSQGESQQSTVKHTGYTMIKGTSSQIIGTTETGPVSTIHTSVVFYIIVGLMTVFVIIAILYGVSYFPKFLHIRGKRNTPNINESADLHYEDFPLQ